MRSLANYLLRKQKEWGEKFDSTDLSQQFVKYFESGERIEVKHSYGEIKRGTVGVTTGWKPSFLLMPTKSSTGSSYLLSDEDEIIRVIK